MRADEPLRAREEDVAWRRVENDLVVLDLRRSSYLTINASGIPLWERLQSEGATRSELVSLLVETFGITHERAGQDVEAFVAMLADKELLA